MRSAVIGVLRVSERYLTLELNSHAGTMRKGMPCSAGHCWQD